MGIKKALLFLCAKFFEVLAINHDYMIATSEQTSYNDVSLYYWSMRETLGKAVFRLTRLILGRLGFSITLSTSSMQFPELSKEELRFIRNVHSSSITFTSFESLSTLAICCKHINSAKIDGDFVEAGVWRGGSSIVAKRMLGENRTFHLFDTYNGMTAPSVKDARIEGGSPESTLQKWKESISGDSSSWDFATLEEVKRNFSRFNLLDSSIRFIVGDVRKTLLEKYIPEKIAVLRLDTDFYDSTLIEMQTLWPRLVSGGILILDDYGHWEGAKVAVDEYFQSNGNANVLMIPIAGGGGRLIIKG
jgi:O-methyltransferase